MLLSAHPKIRLAIIIVASMGAGGALTSAALAGQPHMVAARDLLQRADTQLHLALPDHGGYREQAISATEQAIADVNAGIQVAN
jgi:hypothetical protein